MDSTQAVTLASIPTRSPTLTKPWFLSVSLVATLLFGAATVRGQEEKENLAITDITVIDVANGLRIPHQTVVIAGDRISRIGPTETIEVPSNARKIDGSGKFLLPGLFDAHVHYIHPPSYGPLFIAHGVTFVRDTGGATFEAIAIREQLRKGNILGPEMIVTGAIVDGVPPVWPFSEAVETEEQARAAIKKLAKQGVDQIKVYSKLNRASYFAAVDEAKKQGLKAIGHVPLAVTLREAIEAGQAGIEHLEGFDEAIARAAGRPVPEVRSFRKVFEYWSHLERADREVLRALYADIAKAGTVLCPTLVVMKGVGSVADPDLDDPALATVPGFLIQFWKNPAYSSMAPGAARVVAQMQSVIVDLYKAGVPLICGTDLANPYVFAGKSLHEEMELFQAAGIPTAEVLRCATMNPAKFFGVSDRLGEVKEGGTASLVMVARDPLKDVKNAREIEGVFLRGRFFGKEELEEKVRAVAKSFEKGKGEGEDQDS